MDTETNQPILIQIDDLVREATAEEIAALEEARANAQALPTHPDTSSDPS